MIRKVLQRHKIDVWFIFPFSFLFFLYRKHNRLASLRIILIVSFERQNDFEIITPVRSLITKKLKLEKKNTKKLL